MSLYLGHDLGTGGDKAVLVDGEGRVVAHHTADYPLSHPRPGWAEQDPQDWWRAVCACTRAVLDGIDPTDVRGVAFAGQMLTLVPMDGRGEPTRPALSWLDSRAEAEARRLVRRMGGERILGAVSGGLPTGKDLVAKLAWLARHEPEIHRRTAAYGDATSYLVARATGRVALDPTAAGGTGLFDLKRRRWSRLLARVIRLPRDKMPPIVPSADVAGTLLPAAAAELGLPPGLPVAMGLADIPAAALGSGAVADGAAHVYLGTSAWIAVSMRRPAALPRLGIASVPSAARTGCLLIAESETAGACRDWFATELGEAPEALAETVPPGADGLLFCPWMFGERAPVPSSAVRGAFVNLSLTHTRAHLARAVLEGVAVNLSWILEAIDGLGVRAPGLRAIGGGALSDLWMQILADATGEIVTRVQTPRHAGAVGAALLAAVAVGDLPDVEATARRVRTDRSFRPDPALRPVYARLQRTLQQLAPALVRAAP